VTRRRIHLPPERIEGERGRLGPEALHYLSDVLRLQPGAAVEVFDGRGHAWEGTFTGSEIHLGARREAPAPGAVIWLAFALARGERSDWVVQKCTELGVSRLVPWQAERSVVRLAGARGESRAQRWRRIAAEAARQCGRSDVPEVAEPCGLGRALVAPPAFARVAFDAGAGAPLAEALPTGGEGVLAVVGPEGGLSGDELRACLGGGCRLASLGPRVLRAETAAVVAVALIQHLRGDIA
jgi:16S rRNA (uracil1498-N3)-methyltransferase